MKKFYYAFGGTFLVLTCLLGLFECNRALDRTLVNIAIQEPRPGLLCAVVIKGSSSIDCDWEGYHGDKK